MKRRTAGIFAAIALILGKFGAKLWALVKLLALAKGPVLTMLLTIVAYAVFLGWPFAIGFVLLLFVHEMGHVVAIRIKGGEASLPYFIPFLGAFIRLRTQFADPREDAFVGIAGPIAGTVGAAICWLWYGWTGSILMLFLSYVGFFVNLFNLLPVYPLDGGRVVRAVHRKLWGAGLAVAAAIAVTRPNLILFLILIFGFLEFWRMRNQPDIWIPVSSRIGYGVLYFGLAAFLAVASWGTHSLLLQMGPPA
ncbi:site-2 protease family protein [Kyrpidia spormannii]|uniref:Site-2 protease family protein n=2 Tax=Kyrpidia spormannii TaxID=2055160 RepID=A0A2K8NA92_9BACL|nr:MULTISPECIES: site-2 protease family protein [Kyrpidia]HHY67569.1 site-2 protease family protein [Alicyclobacillus sp.]ATY85540.1 site-2 protease family protein [Kyrpidia spormannii]MCL6574886.1 site-2 protease family protein [Kyrpidia sp.]CAB3393847.1 Site-2 protease family protein [Kyrpidia spormannii]CAB3394771.1 Site-2 protease family protein [Kyrpidia spormannii]